MEDKMEMDVLVVNLFIVSWFVLVLQAQTLDQARAIVCAHARLAV